MKFTILGVVLLSAHFLTVLAVPVAPGQENCVEGEPLLGKLIGLFIQFYCAIPGLQFTSRSQSSEFI